MGKDTKLTDKQAAFVREYLIDLNATQAAIRAGYSPKTAKEQGAQNLTKLNIQEAISKAMQKREKRTEITQDYVLNGLKTVAERCLETKPVLDADGCFTGIFRFNASGANRAFELLGKHLGMFTEKFEHGGSIDILTAIQKGRERAGK